MSPSTKTSSARYEGIPYKLPKLKTIFDIKQYVPPNDYFVGEYNILYYLYATGGDDVFHRTVEGGSISLLKSGEEVDGNDHAFSNQASQLRGKVEFRKSVSNLPLPFDATSFSFSERFNQQSYSEHRERSNIPFSGFHPSMNEVSITGTLNIIGETVAAPYYRDAGCPSTANISTCIGIQFSTMTEALMILDKYSNDIGHSWLCNHMNVPSEIALLVRKFVCPPMAIFFNEGDLLLRCSWYDVTARKRRRLVLIADPRSHPVSISEK
mmetsp:Transcript_13061/g.19893  ORF Transcript_13061/g.19893 Transcript_13061/m.19893 type:complete len:267 (-) Transcript_13061:2271-3071(-)